MNQRLTPKLQVPKKVRIRKAWRLFTSIFWVFIAVFILFQLYKLNFSISNANFSNSEQASAQVEQLQKEIDELRAYLLLPTKNSEEDLESISEQSVEQFLADLIINYERDVQELTRLEVFTRTLDRSYLNLTRSLINTNYQVSEIEDELPLDSGSTRFVTYALADSVDQEPIFTFGFDGTKLFFSSELENQFFLSNQLTDFQSKISRFSELENIQEYQLQILNAGQVKQKLEDFLENQPEQITALLQSKQLSISIQEETPFQILGLKPDNSVAFKIVYNPFTQKFSLLNDRDTLVSANVSEFEELLLTFETFLKINPFETILQKNLREKLEHIQEVLQSTQFLTKLEQLELTVLNEETEDYFFIKFTKADTGQTVFQISLDKSTAEVFTISTNSEPRRISFLSPIQESSNQQRTFLIAGKQGSLTDSLILANIDEVKRKISLLSIPRDLYLDGKKINSVYAQSDMPTLVSTVESLIGRQIENYILIDMFAFIDVVDYLGGVEVYLANPISDPTYRTFDNGIWSTMYFAAGQHKLNGTQALRLARSRYTSSDFARAERQQMLLAAIRDQITSLSFRDIKTFSSIALTLQSKTETDISLNKAITYFFRYKDFQILDQNVLSTQNILVSTYSNEYNNVQCQNCGRGAYILIPQNNDWSLLQTYVNSIFNT